MLLVARADQARGVVGLAVSPTIAHLRKKVGDEEHNSGVGTVEKEL
jgi:hypothetical protein